jgi:hypothetical protein
VTDGGSHDDPFRIRDSQANKTGNCGIEAFLLTMARVTDFLIDRFVLRRLPRQVEAGGLLFLIFLGAALGMTGCASPVRLYHEAEGGDIAALRQPPPGSELPYPNLASVPKAPAALTPTEKMAVGMQLYAARVTPYAGSVPAAPGALAGLTLPGAPPPLPPVPGINWQGLPVAAAPAPPPPPAPAAKPDGPPILLAFPPKTAILTPQTQTALTALALARGNAGIRVGGFGGQDSAANEAPDAAALSLALYRARRIADALTAAGVPPAKISLIAAAAGSGGFAQLVY